MRDWKQQRNRINKQKLIDTDDSLGLAGGGGEEQVDKGKGGQIYLAVEEDLIWGGERGRRHADDVLQNSTLKTYVILLTDTTPTNPTKSRILFYVSIREGNVLRCADIRH